MISFLTVHVFTTRTFNDSNSASRSSLRSKHLLKLVQQTEVHVPAATAFPDFSAERLQTRVAPRVAAQLALQLLGSFAAHVHKSHVVAAPSRSLDQTATTWSQDAEQRCVEAFFAVCSF